VWALLESLYGVHIFLHQEVNSFYSNYFFVPPVITPQACGGMCACSQWMGMTIFRCSESALCVLYSMLIPSPATPSGTDAMSHGAAEEFRLTYRNTLKVDRKYILHLSGGNRLSPPGDRAAPGGIYKGDSMEHIVLDITELFTNPKEAFRRIITYESLKYPSVMVFICGILLGFRRFLTAQNSVPTMPQDITPMAYGLRDAEVVMAFLTPFLVVGFWFLCTLMVHLIAEKLGAMRGELNELLMSSGYLSVPVLMYLLLSFPLFYLGNMQKNGLCATLDVIIAIGFFIWLFFVLTQLLEAVCEMPMAYAGISLVLTFLAFLMIYYGFIDMILKQLLLAGIFAKRY